MDRRMDGSVVQIGTSRCIIEQQQQLKADLHEANCQIFASKCIFTLLIFIFVQDIFHCIGLDILPAFPLFKMRPTGLVIPTCVCITCFKTGAQLNTALLLKMHVCVRAARLYITYSMIQICFNSIYRIHSDLKTNNALIVYLFKIGPRFRIVFGMF